MEKLSLKKAAASDRAAAQRLQVLENQLESECRWLFQSKRCLRLACCACSGQLPRSAVCKGTAAGGATAAPPL